MKIVEHELDLNKESKLAEIYEEIKTCNIKAPFDSNAYAKEHSCAEPFVRMVIRELRLQGIRICSDPSRRGYWLDENGGGYKQTRAHLLSRAYRILEVVRAMDNCKDGQYEWGVFDGQKDVD